MKISLSSSVFFIIHIKTTRGVAVNERALNISLFLKKPAKEATCQNVGLCWEEQQGSVEMFNEVEDGGT